MADLSAPSVFAALRLGPLLPAGWTTERRADWEVQQDEWVGEGWKFTAVVVDPDGNEVELSQVAAAEPASSGGTWAVWRQDDNGNRFRVSGRHAREEADRLCRELEARGHKQLYWVSPDGERG